MATTHLICDEFNVICANATSTLFKIVAYIDVCVFLSSFSALFSYVCSVLKKFKSEKRENL